MACSSTATAPVALAELGARPCGGCKSACLGGLLNGRAQTVAVSVPGAPAVGASVDVALRRRDFTAACVWVFGVPLLGVAMGASVASAATTHAGVLPAVLGGLLAMGCVLVSRRWLRRWLDLGLTAALPRSPEH